MNVLQDIIKMNKDDSLLLLSDPLRKVKRKTICHI